MDSKIDLKIVSIIDSIIDASIKEPTPGQSSASDDVEPQSSEKSFEGKVNDWGNFSRSSFWREDASINIDVALEFAETGKFHIMLYLVCFIAFTTTTMIPNVIYTFSNSIQCEYQFINEDTKAINSIMSICMILGGVGWSFLADSLSRKWTLVFILLFGGVSAVGIYMSTTFFTFGLFRGLTAFCLSATTSVTITYLAEFQNKYIRGSMICALQLAWVVGTVIVPLIDISWRHKILLSVVPSLIAAFGLLFFPDSPRFLFSRGRPNQAIQSIQYIHKMNTGKKFLDFPIRRLVDNKNAEEISRSSIVKRYIHETLRIRCYCYVILILSTFIFMFSYYTMALLFAEMVPRDESFLPNLNVTKNFPIDCQIRVEKLFKRDYGPPEKLNIKLAQNTEKQNFSAPKKARKKPLNTPRSARDNPCDKHGQADSELYMRRRLLIGFSCLPSIIWLVFRVDTLGRKFFIIFPEVLGGCLVFGAYFMHGSSHELFFASGYEALTLLTVAASQCIAVDLFPTRIRALGLALVLGAGQLGMILGSLGAALNNSCILIAASLALALVASGMLVLAIPETAGIALR